MNQLAKVTDALKHVTRYTYDQTGSLLIQNVGDGQTVESSYNDIGMVTEVSGAEGSITYQYDERGYLLSVENVNGDVVSYTYDEYGNKTSMTYPDGRVVSYTYDRMNRMTGVTGLDGEVTTYTYDAAGRRTETSGNTLTTSYRYDSVGNLVEQVTHGESEIAFSYAYDRNGYLTGEIRRENGTTVASSYAYDAAGQLTEFLQTTGYGERYAYDKAGNMTEKVLTGTDGAETTLAMKYNKGNQLTSMANGRDKIAYTYDRNGSMVQKVLASQTYGRLTDSYAYNALDQLTEYVGYDGYRQAFTYDANGMRQSKSEAGDANRSTLEELLRGNVAGLPEIVEPAQSQTNADVPAGLEWATTEYLYDLTQEYYQVISETTTYANGTSATTAYAYGLERIAAYHEIGVTRYVYDGRGSVAQTVNVPVAGEAVSSNLPDISVKVQSFTYTAYGEQMGGVKVSGFTYNAEAYDAATGMLNLRARQYEPALNRFSQKDIYPANLLIPQSFNAYLFTYNSPVGFVDGDGLSAKSLGSVLSSIGSKVQKVVSGIGNTVKTVATAIFGEKVVNTVVSGVKSVARTIRKAAQPIVDTVSTAWNKATQMYREAQEEISRLDKTAPDYHLQVDAIYRSACARYMGVEEKTSAAKSSDKTLYYNDGAMHCKGVEYELPTAVTVLKVPRFESANQKSTTVLSASSTFSQSFTFDLLRALGFGEMQGSDDLAFNNFGPDGKAAMKYYGTAALLTSLTDYIAAGASRTDVSISLKEKGESRYATIMVGSFEYQQMVYHLADGIQRSNRGIQLTLSPERRNNPYYGQLVIDENGELAIEQYIFQGDKIIIDGVDRTNDLRYPIPVDNDILEVLQKIMDSSL